MKVDKENDPHVRLYKDYSSSSNPSPSAKNSQCQMPQCDNGKLLSLLYLLLHLEKKNVKCQATHQATNPINLK